MKASTKSSAGIARGLEMFVGRCECNEAKGFRSPDALSPKGRKGGTGRTEGRDGDRKLKEGRKKEKEEGPGELAVTALTGYVALSKPSDGFRPFCVSSK